MAKKEPKLGPYAFTYRIDHGCRDPYRHFVLTLYRGDWSKYSDNAVYYSGEGKDTATFVDRLGKLVLCNRGDDRTFNDREHRVAIKWQSGSDDKDGPEWQWAPERWYGVSVYHVGALSDHCVKLLQVAYGIRGRNYGDSHPQDFMRALVAKGFVPVKRMEIEGYWAEYVLDRDFTPESAAPTYEQRVERDRLQAEQAESAASASA